MQRGWKVWILLAVVLGSTAFALGFSVRGAVRYDLSLNKLGWRGSSSMPTG